MNTAIFTLWLLRLDEHIGLARERKELLFFDNASAHGAIANIIYLEHEHIQFLPKKTTSILQPLDLGAIVSLKKHHRNRVVNCAVEHVNERRYEDLYHIY